MAMHIEILEPGHWRWHTPGNIEDTRLRRLQMEAIKNANSILLEASEPFHRLAREGKTAEVQRLWRAAVEKVDNLLRVYNFYCTDAHKEAGSENSDVYNIDCMTWKRRRVSSKWRCERHGQLRRNGRWA